MVRIPASSSSRSEQRARGPHAARPERSALGDHLEVRLRSAKEHGRVGLEVVTEMAELVERILAKARILIRSLLAEDDGHIRVMGERQLADAVADVTEDTARVRDFLTFAGHEHADDRELEPPPVGARESAAGNLLRFVQRRWPGLICEALCLEQGREEQTSLVERRLGVHGRAEGRGRRTEDGGGRGRRGYVRVYDAQI